MAASAEEFKRALGRWASGVAIVTSRAGERIHGMTVSSLASVSLAPPLVLVCTSKASDTYGLVREAGVFAANLLAAGQEALSRRFAEEGNEERRFEGLEIRTGVTGAPLLPGVLASLDCRVVAAHEAGDHVILVGRVEALSISDAKPLIYYQGAYRSLAD